MEGGGGGGVLELDGRVGCVLFQARMIVIKVRPVLLIMIEQVHFAPHFTTELIWIYAACGSTGSLLSIFVIINVVR